MEARQTEERTKRGNLNDEDGRRYDNQIENLQNNQRTIQKVMKHQMEWMAMITNQEQSAYQAIAFF